MPDINTSSMLAVGTILNDRYRIERHLSSGGFGNTYLATSLIFNEMVAVKEFFLRGITQREGNSTISVSNSDNKLLFDEQLKKFKKEAQRIRQLHSSNIVHVHDLFEANGTAYYVMDFIDGESLADRITRTGQPLSEAETRKYLDQVLDALNTIHGAGLLHMDLKPDNIMIDRNDNAVLIDFGASKRTANEQLTSTVTAVSYTSGYAPPEQIEQDTDHFGPWTDIYALGATLYQLLTNRKPPMPSAIYSDPTADKHQSLKFPEGVSVQMRQLIMKMMTVAWYGRPQSVEAVRHLMGINVGPNVLPPVAPPAYNPVNTYDSAPNNDYGGVVENSYDGGNDGNYESSYEGDYDSSYEEESSTSRKWVYLLICVLASILIGGGIIAYNKLSKPGSEAVSTERANANFQQNDEQDMLQNDEGESEESSNKEKTDESIVENGTKQEQSALQSTKELKAEEQSKKAISDEGQAKTSRQESAQSTSKSESPKADDKNVYDVVESMPIFPGGQGGLVSWLSQNIKYPAVAVENGIQGRVTVSFVVEKNGSISNVNVVKSVDPSLDNEAVRVVRSMPRWTPGKQNGQPVRVKYTIPVNFKL